MGLYCYLRDTYYYLHLLRIIKFDSLTRHTRGAECTENSLKQCLNRFIIIKMLFYFILYKISVGMLDCDIIIVPILIV